VNNSVTQDVANGLVPDPTSELDVWWQRLRAAALVGTARRVVPDLPSLGVIARPAATREHRLLDAAALGDALRRAGRLADLAPDPGPSAPPETLQVAPSHAVQMLELLLIQGPVGAGSREALTRHWLDTAAAAGRVVPPRLLPALLDLASGGDDHVRRSVRPVVGERGRWLSARNAVWSWVAENDSGEDSAHPATPDRTEEVAAARTVDPAAGRELVLNSWETDGAKDRAAALVGFVVGVGPDDEDFLERCLDDRAKGVRERAASLLDRLPRSARAERMARRLRDLLSVRGALRKGIEVALPDDPDPAGIRDGLVDPGKGVSRRGRWLEEIVTGAPLWVWTDLVGGNPAKVVAMLRGENATAVLPALRTAAAVRGEVVWARALLAAGWDTRLLALLPDSEREALLVDRLGRRPLSEVAHELVQAPTPWGPELSAVVVTKIGLEKDAGHAVRVLRETLATALHPTTAPAVERLMKGAGEDGFLRRALRDVLQHQSLHRSISEAFR
jgi:Family of unknown function (DUF5691)